MKKIVKKMKFLILLLITAPAFAQNSIPITKGHIEFEKRINKYAILKESMENSSISSIDFENYKKNNTQFQVLNFTLYFNNDQSLYIPSITSNGGDIVSQVTSKNTTYINLLARTYISQKQIFSEVFLVKDSLKKIKWKIMEETREIAGYVCRRANAIILDSVYVVAFYSTDIAPSCGPELFNGLPGMTLGISLPHEHITWFAKIVSDQVGSVNPNLPPERGRKVTEKELKTIVAADTKHLGIPTTNTILKNIMY